MHGWWRMIHSPAAVVGEDYTGDLGGVEGGEIGVFMRLNSFEDDGESGMLG